MPESSNEYSPSDNIVQLERNVTWHQHLHCINQHTGPCNGCCCCWCWRRCYDNTDIIPSTIVRHHDRPWHRCCSGGGGCHADCAAWDRRGQWSRVVGFVQFWSVVVAAHLPVNGTKDNHTASLSSFNVLMQVSFFFQRGTGFRQTSPPHPVVVGPVSLPNRTLVIDYGWSTESQSPQYNINTKLFSLTAIITRYLILSNYSLVFPRLL